MTVVVLGGCDGAPTGPTGPGVLRIAGPSTIAPSSSVQFSAVYFKDGANTDVTSSTVWSTSSSDTVRIGADGMAVGLITGEATITARYEQVSDVRPILVVAPNTFKLSSRVTEPQSPFPGISGALVEVLQGTGAGQRTITRDFTGAFALFGVGGSVRIRVSADGYEPAQLDTTIDSHVDIPQIPLKPAGGTAGALSGRWLLTLGSPPCTFLPEAARTRMFVADITQTGARVVLNASGPGVEASATTGQLVEGKLLFQFPTWEDGFLGWPSYGLLDRFQPPAFLGIKAYVTLALNQGSAPNQLDGFFDGSFDYFPTGRYDVMNPCAGRGQATLRR